jgi:hypothetical protein
MDQTDDLRADHAEDGESHHGRDRKRRVEDVGRVLDQEARADPPGQEFHHHAADQCEDDRNLKPGEDAVRRRRKLDIEEHMQPARRERLV